MSVAPPNAEFSLSAPNGRYTYADYLTWHYPPYVELIRGWASILPTPWTRHQQCSGNLLVGIDGFLHKHPTITAKVWRGPLDVRLLATRSDDYQTTTVVLPDFFVVLDPQQMDEIGCVGAPAWIIEIISPGTATRDTHTKFDLYAETGVTEYWLVYPGERIITTFVLRNGKYEATGEYYEPGLIPSRTIPELPLQWADVFEDVRCP